MGVYPLHGQGPGGVPGPSGDAIDGADPAAAVILVGNVLF